MTTPTPFPHPRPAAPGGIPRAHAGIITDDMLEQAVAAGQALRDDTLTVEQGRILWLVAAPAFAELLQRRRAAEVIQDMLDPANVLFLRDARGAQAGQGVR